MQRKERKRLNQHSSPGPSDVKRPFPLVSQTRENCRDQADSFGTKEVGLAVRVDKGDFKLKAVHVAYLFIPFGLG